MNSEYLLIRRMKSGDQNAVEEFVKLFYPPVLKYCCLHIADHGDAEDICQDCFEHFFRSFHNYNSCGKAKNYLYSIAANLCKDYYRRRKDLVTDELPESSFDSTGGINLKLDLLSALNSLPQDIRETAILFFVQEQKQKDIARIQSISLPLVKYRIKKARELLTEFLGKGDAK